MFNAVFSTVMMGFSVMTVIGVTIIVFLLLLRGGNGQWPHDDKDWCLCLDPSSGYQECSDVTGPKPPCFFEINGEFCQFMRLINTSVTYNITLKGQKTGLDCDLRVVSVGGGGRGGWAGGG